MTEEPETILGEIKHGYFIPNLEEIARITGYDEDKLNVFRNGKDTIGDVVRSGDYVIDITLRPAKVVGGGNSLSNDKDGKPSIVYELSRDALLRLGIGDESIEYFLHGINPPKAFMPRSKQEGLEKFGKPGFIGGPLLKISEEAYNRLKGRYEGI